MPLPSECVFRWQCALRLTWQLAGAIGNDQEFKNNGTLDESSRGKA